MKTIKKIIALVIAATLICGIFAGVMSANAATIFGFEFPEKQEPDLVRWLVYSSDDKNVSCVYVPGGTVRLEDGDVIVTDEVPLAIDHNFLYWEDDEGNIYHAGDKFHVTEMVTLYAVWEEKNDGEGHIMHVIKTCIKALSKILSFVFGIFEYEESFSVQYEASRKAAEEASRLAEEAAA